MYIVIGGYGDSSLLLAGVSEWAETWGNIIIRTHIYINEHLQYGVERCMDTATVPNGTKGKLDFLQ